MLTFYSLKSWWSMLPSRLHRPKSWWSIGSSGAMAPAPLPRCTSSWHVLRHLGVLPPASVAGREGRQSLRHWFTEKLYTSQVCGRKYQWAMADTADEDEAEWTVEEARVATDWWTRRHRRNYFLSLARISLLITLAFSCDVVCSTISWLHSVFRQTLNLSISNHCQPL